MTRFVFRIPLLFYQRPALISTRLKLQAPVFFEFLDATSHLYKRVRPFVCLSVCRSVCLSVRRLRFRQNS